MSRKCFLFLADLATVCIILSVLTIFIENYFLWLKLEFVMLFSFILFDTTSVSLIVSSLIIMIDSV